LLRHRPGTQQLRSSLIHTGTELMNLAHMVRSKVVGLSLLVAAAVFFVTSPAHATLVLEDFNYGTGSGAINGQNGGTGWGGAWTGGGTSLIQYIPTGLIFADVPSSGGAAKFVGQGPITRPFAAAFDHDQNLFGSFLVNVPASDGNLELLGISDAAHATSDSTVQLGFTAALLNSNNHVPAVNVLGGTAQNLNSAGLAGSTTYMYLFHYSGPAASDSVTAWMLNATQYSNWEAAGNTESYLNSATIGTSATGVSGRATATGTVTQTFSTLLLYSLSGFNPGATYDHIALSSSSITDAIGVPEPASLTLLGTAGIGAVLLLRRRPSVTAAARRHSLV
jgi:hypothetical protein